MTETINSSPKRGVPLWVQTLIWVFLVALLVIMGVGLHHSQQGTVQPGEQIPDFMLTLYSGYEYQGGSQVRLADLRGKVVVVNFWASWCKPCEQEAAELQQAWEFYSPAGQVVFLGADYVDTPNESFSYMKKFGITFPNGPADAHPKFKLSQIFRIKGVPETYFIDPDGVLQYVKVGPFSSLDEIKSVVKGLIR
jgi:cytochrome c biogenesis protein CcmG/thiol:disulfide interchange protein DsbE